MKNFFDSIKNRGKSTNRGLLCAAFALMAQPLLAEPSEQKEDYSLEKVVTTASGFAQDIKDAPASISVVDEENLKSRPVRDLGDAVSLVPGVSIDQSVGKTGGYDISIRGLPSGYTLILMDGKRQNITSAAFPNGFTTAFTGFMPPISAIERIEVIKGPASTLYGSDAVGGIINIITKKHFDKWGSSITLDALFQEKKQFGHLYGLNFYTAGALDKEKKFSLTLRGREQYRQPVPTSSLVVIPGGGSLNRNAIVGLSQSNASNLGARLGYRPDDKNYFYIDYDWGLQWYDNSQGLLGTPTVAGGYKKDLFFMRNNFIAAYQTNHEKVKTDTSIQYNSTLNRGRLITPALVGNNSPLLGQDRNLLGQDILVEHKTIFALGDFSNVSVGGRYWFTSLVDRAVPKSFNAQHNFSLFAENETSILRNLILTLGFREDYNSAFGFHASPRGYLVYNAYEGEKTGNLTFKGGISTGYQVPSVIALVRGVNGLTAQGTVPTYGNPSLKPESSINYELGGIYSMKYVDLGATGFFIQFKDKIQSQSVASGQQIPVEGGGVCNATNNGTCGYSVNADSAISYGMESFIGYKALADVKDYDLNFNLSYTFNKTRQTSGPQNGIPLTDIPQHSLNGAITFAYKNVSAYLRGEFRAMQLRNNLGGRGSVTPAAIEAFKAANPGVSEYYKPYFLCHIGVGYQINKMFRLNFGIYNLFNQNFIDYIAINSTGGANASPTYLNNYNYVREGRRYYISLNMDF